MSQNVHFCERAFKYHILLKRLLVAIVEVQLLAEVVVRLLNFTVQIGKVEPSRFLLWYHIWKLV